MHKLCTVVSLFVLLHVFVQAANADTPAPQSISFSSAGFTALDVTGPTDKLLKNGSIQTQTDARIVITELAGAIQKIDPECDPKKSSFIINVVSFGDPTKVLLKGFSKIGPVQSSIWYVYDASQKSFSQFTGSAIRIYGSKQPYLIVIHINSDLNSFTGTSPAVSMKYQYTVSPRQPANIQDLESAITLFKSIVTPNTGAAPAFAPGTPPPPTDFWTWSALSVNSPAGIAMSGSIIPGTDTADTAILDKTPPQFDDEGFYHWDISVGIPITSYTQVQTIDPTTGQAPVPANINERNLILLADLYLKPVDLKTPGTGLAVPYLVGGVSFASKPLHNAMAGIGVGLNAVAFYVGTMFVTSNLPNDIKKTNIKLAFGINLPIRAVMGKLGINTQVTSGP